MRKRNLELMKHIIAFSNEFQRLNGKSPTTREIAKEVGIASGTAYTYLVFMRDNGIIEYDGKNIVTRQSSRVNHSNNNAPIVGRVVCGDATEEEAEVKEFVDLPSSIFGNAELFLLEAYGDSMNLAGIDAGDYVVVRKQNTAEDGDLVIALTNNENNLKRIKFDPDNREILLCPESTNPKHKVHSYKEVQIQGVVTHIIKQAR